jgi:acetoacetyl-CoA synthetase
MLGHPLEKVVNRQAMANPACIAWYEEFARRHMAEVEARSGQK